MKRLMIMGLMLAINVAVFAQAQERKMLSVEDAVWNVQVGARSIPAQQTGQLSVEEAMMPMTAQAQRQMLSVQDSLWNAQMNGQATFGQPAQPSYYQNDTLYAQAVYAPQYAYAPPVYQPQSYPMQMTYDQTAPMVSYPIGMPILPVRWTHPAAITHPAAQTVALIHTAPTRKTAKRQPAQPQPKQSTQAEASQLTVTTVAGETQIVLSSETNAAQLDVLKTVAQQQTEQAMRQTEIEHAKTLLWIGAIASAPFVLAIGWSTTKILQELRLMADARRHYELLQQQERRKELEIAERIINTPQ